MTKNTLFTDEPLSKNRSADDGKIFYRCWKGSSSQVLIYLHGIQSHSEWLSTSGQELSQRGITVYAPDRRGSGQSGFAAGDCADYRILMDDLRSFVRFVQNKEPGKKLHLAGLCWGARLSAPLSLENNLGIESLVFLSPGLYPKVDYPLRKKIQIGWSCLFNPKKMFSLPLQDENFTQNLRYLEFIRQDSLGLRKVTARFLMETLKLNQLARNDGMAL